MTGSNFDTFVGSLYCSATSKIEDKISMLRAQCTGAGRVQARPHGVQLSAQSSTPVHRRPHSVSLYPVSHPDNTFALPTEVFSSCLAIVSAVNVGGLFLWPALLYGTGYQTVWETRPSAETPSDVHWRRFYFQLSCVHSALEFSGRCALQIYLLTTVLCWRSLTLVYCLSFAIASYTLVIPRRCQTFRTLTFS